MISTSKPSQSTDKDGKELQLVKGAFVVIIAGNHKGHYCQVQGLDDENSRVIVKTAITNEVLNLNEFLIVPVTNEEYAKASKIISKRWIIICLWINVKINFKDNAKYEEYQEKSNHKIQKRDKSGDRDRSRSRSRSRHKKKESVSRSREREKKKRKKSKKSKHDAHSSDSDNERRRKNKKKSKSKYKSSDSDSEREHRRKKDKETRR